MSDFPEVIARANYFEKHNEFNLAIEMYTDAVKIIKASAEKQTGEMKDYLEDWMASYNFKINELKKKVVHANFPKIVFPPYYPDDCRAIHGAMNALKSAYDLDKNEQYQDALSTYKHGLNLLNDALKMEMNPERKVIFKEFLMCCLRRAEEIKAIVDQVFNYLL